MTAPLDIDGYKLRTAMPSADVDRLEADFAGFVVVRATVNYARLCAQLAKRYATPFASPIPEIVLGWVVALTDPDLYRKRGWNPGDDQIVDIEQVRKDALEEIKLAADAVGGLFELPLREGSAANGVVKGTPLVYSEQSPYTWTDLQAQAARDEDSNGRR